MKTKYIFVGIAVFFISISSAHANGANQTTEKINKSNVIRFYEKAINEKDYEAAEAYLGDKYIQHNPAAADGKEGLKSFISYLKTNFPEYHSEIKRVFTDGDFVILHVRNTPQPGALGKAIVDIFRLEKGKIVEHWDVIQEIPENPANSNGMF